MEGPKLQDRKRNNSILRHLEKRVNPIMGIPIEDVVVEEVAGEALEVVKDQDHTISISPEVIVTRAQRRLVVITSKARASGCAVSLLRIECALIGFCCVGGEISFTFEYDSRPSRCNV